MACGVFHLGENIFTALAARVVHSGIMKREPNPYKQATMNSRLIDMNDGRHSKVRKALDSIEADRRSALPSGTVKLEDQAIGWEFIKQVSGHRYENSSDARFVGLHLGYTALFSGLYTSASHTSEVMNRVVDIPEMAADDWRQTEKGLWVQAGSIIDSSVRGSHELAFRHSQSIDSADRTRRVGRSFGSAAAFLFNIGQPIPAGTPFEVQFAVRERVMDAGFAARQQVDEIGKFPSVSALADIDSPQSSWLRRNAPSQEVYSAITQAQEELRRSV